MVDTRTTRTAQTDFFPARERESGFTLIEVLIAILLLGIITTAAIAFSIQGLSATAAQERREVAVAVATDAMESVNARIAATDAATGVSYLMAGRTQAKVNTAWADNSSFPGVSQTYPAWDSTATTASVPTIPITVSPAVSRNGTDYSVTTLIGWCYKQSAAGDCTRIPTVTAAPATAPAGWANRLIRVITIVKWSAGPNCTATLPCSYEEITLVDATTDLEWNNS